MNDSNTEKSVLDKVMEDLHEQSVKRTKSNKQYTCLEKGIRAYSDATSNRYLHIENAILVALFEQRKQIRELFEKEFNCKFCTNSCMLYRGQEDKCILQKEFDEQ